MDLDLKKIFSIEFEGTLGPCMCSSECFSSLNGIDFIIEKKWFV